MPPPGFAQPRPVLQVLPAQQAAPMVPHAWQDVIPAMPITGRQDEPAWQALGLLTPPAQQRTHMRAAPAIAAAAQTAPEAVQMLPAQQTSPTAPHGVTPPSPPTTGR